MTPALRTGLDIAERLFNDLATTTADPPGVTRPSFGPGERQAHEFVAEAARKIGLEVEWDAIGTLRAVLPGRDRSLPVVVIGSHLDSVPHGGNFDGAAGVIMGIAAASALVAQGYKPERDLLILGIRAEEMCWFHANYLGSRALFGLLPADAPDTLLRADSKRSLADHMVEEGFDPTSIRERRALLDPARVACFLEPHIEQGPALVEANLPIAIVTGIRGSLRYPSVSVVGEHAHAGAVPRRYRRDAALAGVAFLAELDARWNELEAAGADLVFTTGIIATDVAVHTPTKIPGFLRFSLDIRSEDAALLEELDAWLREQAERIGKERGVSFDFGLASHAKPALMDPKLQEIFKAAAVREGVPSTQMASGAGHDCATFAHLGIPSVMLFLRNPNGSHNPDEAMEIEDFGAGLKVLVASLETLLA